LHRSGIDAKIKMGDMEGGVASIAVFIAMYTYPAATEELK
jgi:hypothetical protein